MLLAFPLALRAQSYSHRGDIIADPLTGAAVMGYDVVAFFIENRALAGDPAVQTNHAGKAWYFTSQANRLAFEERPEAFLPAFGGHDPTALAAGVLRAGSPQHFLRVNDKLYLFRDAEARSRLMADPAVLEAAARLWPELKRDLDP